MLFELFAATVLPFSIHICHTTKVNIMKLQQVVNVVDFTPVVGRQDFLLLRFAIKCGDFFNLPATTNVANGVLVCCWY